jgi:predicted HTH transcriptional regulator
MADQMLDHGLDRPLLETDTGYFQVTFPGPGENIERLRVPQSRLVVTPAVEAQLNERQRRMLLRLVEGEELTSRQCEAEFSVTRTITSSDFRKLVELGLAERMGAGRSTRYRLKGASESSTNRQVDRRNRKPGKGKGTV